MTIDVLNKEGKKVSEVELKDELLGLRVNTALFYEVVKMQRANKRSGCASTKTRDEVSGSGAKPWKQKGTGRARAGEKRSPVWRHGGVVFGPHPRSYAYSMPKGAVKEAMRSALKYKADEGKLKIIDTIELPEPKTKLALDMLKKFNLKSALIVTDAVEDNLMLSIRNLKDFKMLKADAINVYDILRYEDLVMTRAALDKTISKLKGAPSPSPLPQGERKKGSEEARR